jgi:two-component system sensor kinase FixL
MVSCTVRCQQPGVLADKTAATHLYRIAQEAVSNAIRHGKAAHVWIYLGWKENKLTLRIRDDGSGFSKSQAFRKGLGMRSMRLRADIIGGLLTIKSRRGTGTSLTCVYTGARSRSAAQARSHSSG